MNSTQKRGKCVVGGALVGVVLSGAVISSPSAAAQTGDILGEGACALGTHQLGEWMKAAARPKLPGALKIFTVGAAGTACALAVNQFEEQKPATFEFQTGGGQTITRTLHFNDFVSPPMQPKIDLREYAPYWPGGRCEGFPVGAFYDICVNG